MGYTRKFVILKKELGNMRQTGLRGHSKLEVKGIRGSVVVNIENGEVNDFYNVGFISKDKSNQILNLGKIFTDEIGRGKGEYAFVQKDFKMEDIIGMLITKDKDIFLGGYIDKEDGRIEKYVKSISKILRIEEIEPEILEEDIFEELEEIIEAYEEFTEEHEEFIGEPEYEFEPEEEIFIEEIQPEVDSHEENIMEDDIDEITWEEQNEEQSEEEKMEPDYKVIDHMKKLNQKNQTTNYVLSILRFFPYVDPFKYNLSGYNWWIVELDEENEYRSFLPYFSYLTDGNNKEPYSSQSITCNQLMDIYQHYIFGLYNEDEEVKYFVYGVPGSFKTEEHPNGGENGFNTWYEGETVGGYWIIYIDPMTGKPVYPLNPMIPIE